MKKGKRFPWQIQNLILQWDKRMLRTCTLVKVEDVVEDVVLNGRHKRESDVVKEVISRLPERLRKLPTIPYVIRKLYREAIEGVSDE